MCPKPTKLPATLPTTPSDSTSAKNNTVDEPPEHIDDVNCDKMDQSYSIADEVERKTKVRKLTATVMKLSKSIIMHKSHRHIKFQLL